MDQTFRVGQLLLADGYKELVVCDVREDGTAYAQGSGENERVMISDRGAATMVIETRAADRCKCLARTYQDHQERVAAGRATAHTYKGFVWLPPGTEKQEG